ncbi:MAG TPA: hypothetical protein VN861_14290 [Candidatus Acidoferrales bacterium]|nr:hypothetical protein [Candidatus Acidoferrales bacterium]
MPTRPALPLAMCFALLLSFAVASPAHAQESASAPVPAQLITAGKIFISNAGGDIDPNTKQLGEFIGLPIRPYNDFYAAMKSWGRYQLVSAPSDADLIFEISFSVSPATGGADAKFHLVILDPKTHVTLWAFTEYVETAILAGNREKHFQQGMESIVADAKSLSTFSAPAPAKN